MIIQPIIRNNICINSHPAGCAASVRHQIEYAGKTLGANQGGAGPKLALIIGCSTGYGLASRITAAFGCHAATVGISFEKPPTKTRAGTPGYYNNLVFDKEAAKAGLASKSLNGDAYSDAMKGEAVKAIKETAAAAGLSPQVDLIIYSLASPVRTDPKDGVMYRSVIKPIGESFSGKTIDMMSGKFTTASAEPASEEDIYHTVKVMGGEDWELWIKALDEAGILAPSARTVAYTYIGPKFSWAIYKNGTIGRAKEDLERACREINKTLTPGGGRAWISVNKALVTRASAVIPIIPFYVSCLFKVMKEKGVHEGCIEQIVRLYRDRLYADAGSDPAKVPVDSEGRIRIDDWEMREDVQQATAERMDSLTEETIMSDADVGGFRHDFLVVHGFDVEGVNYDAELNPLGLDL